MARSSYPFVERYEMLDWRGHYMLVIHKTIHNHQNYQIYHYFLDFPNGSYKKKFRILLNLISLQAYLLGVSDG